MKANAITRIVIFSLVILILIGILAAGILLPYFSSGNQVGTLASSGSVDAKRVKNIHIQWVGGSISILPGDTEQITFAETEGLAEEYQMMWNLSGDTLNIQFCRTQSIMGINISIPDKALVVTVPREWVMGELDIESVSAEILVSRLTGSSIEIENVSGECNIEHCTVMDSSVETVSGEVEITGEANSVELTTVSADCTVFTSNLPQRIELDSVSGDLFVYLFEDNAGFTATMDSVSGDISSDFPITIYGGEPSYGDGSCRIRCDSVSGNLYIRKPIIKPVATEAGS